MKKIFKNIKNLRYNVFPLKTWWKVRKWYKMPTPHFYIGKLQKKVKQENGSSNSYQYVSVDNGYFYFVSYDYLKWSNILGVTFDSSDVGWKWKFDDIRYETDPYVSIIFGSNVKKAFQIAIWFTAPKVKAIYNRNIRKGDWRNLALSEDYWETLLETLHKYNGDFKKMCQEEISNYWTSSNEDKVRVSAVLNPNFLTGEGCRILSEVLTEKNLDEYQIKEQEKYDKYLENK